VLFVVVVGAGLVVGALDDEFCGEEDLRPVNASQILDIVIDSRGSARYRRSVKLVRTGGMRTLLCWGWVDRQSGGFAIFPGWSRLRGMGSATDKEPRAKKKKFTNLLGWPVHRSITLRSWHQCVMRCHSTATRTRKYRQTYLCLIV